MVSQNITDRLLKYRLGLLHLKNMGLENVNSKTLSNEVRISSDLIRKDFSYLKIRGKRKVGYEINMLIDIIDRMFFIGKGVKVVLFGVGNIGRALINHKLFEKNNIQISAAFDIDPFKQKKVSEIEVLPPQKAKEYIALNNITVAIIAVPEFSAQYVCSNLVDCGIKGILNFAPVLLKTPEDVFVNNINLCDELALVMYHSMDLKEKE